MPNEAQETRYKAIVERKRQIDQKRKEKDLEFIRDLSKRDNEITLTIKKLKSKIEYSPPTESNEISS